MKIICAVKFVPDVDKFVYDYENSALVRENVRLILNPDDACALAFALKIKATNPDYVVEVVSMGPQSVVPHMEDLLRLNVDRGTIICDPKFAGSDTYVTSKILGRYLSSRPFDCLLTGCHTLDGGTSHVPAQIAELLGLPHMSGIVKIDETRFDRTRAVFEVEDETSVSTYEIALPTILSLDRESTYKLPYPKYEDFNRTVKDCLTIISNKELGFDTEEVGQKGSLTRVVKTYKKSYQQRDKKILQANEKGIEQVFLFLKEKGYI